MEGAPLSEASAISGGIRRLLSSSARGLRFRLGATGRPRMIANFAVTYRCSSRCRTCNIWQMSDAGGGELTLAEIEDIFRSNADFLRDVESIQITGGEPFLRQDLPVIVSVIRRYLPRCTFWIPTNGMAPGTIEGATREMLTRLDGRGLGISVSIDGIEETHDAMRGVEGCYQEVVRTLQRLSALRKEHPSLTLTVGMTLTPLNYKELWDVFALSRGHDADFSFRPVNFSDIYYRNLGGAFDLRMTLDEIIPVIRKIGRSRMERLGLLRSSPTLRYMQGVIDYIRNPDERRIPCSACYDSFFLDPYGNVYPCIIMDHRIGNVREAPLEEIWASEEAREARRMVRRGLCPNCWVECETFRDIHMDALGLLSTAIRALFHPSSLGIN